MKLCGIGFHRYTNWRVYKETEKENNAGFPVYICIQMKKCQRCDKLKLRTVRSDTT